MSAKFAAAGASRESGGFTLLELLAVLGILTVLTLIAVPIYQRIVESGRATACVGNLRQIGAALTLYLGENNMKMPTLRAGRAASSDEVPVIDNTLDRYVNEKRVFTCPADRRGWRQRPGRVLLERRAKRPGTR